MSDGYRHEAAFYSGSDGFLEATMPFITGAIASEEPVLVAVDPGKIRTLRSVLGTLPANVAFADMREMGANPARIIPQWREFVDRHAGLGIRMRGIGEPVWAGRDADALDECHRHEALLNRAFEDARSFWLMCPYDTAALEQEVVEKARRTHPFVREGGTLAPSEAYEEDLSGATFMGDLPQPEGHVAAFRFDVDSLNDARNFVWEHARAAGLDSNRAGDLVLAAAELANNSVRYGGGSGLIRFWAKGETACFEVADSGHIADPIAGRSHPSYEQLDGRGLWLVNQVCDLVQIRSSEAGTVVRLSMRVA